MADDRPYRAPILTSVFHVFGAVCLVASIYLGLSTPTDSYGSGLYISPSGALLHWLPCGAVLFVGLLCFAVGLAIDYIGEIAHNTRRMPATAPAERFFYQDATGQPAGPVTLDELRRMAAGGTIETDTLVCQEGREDWLPLAGRG